MKRVAFIFALVLIIFHLHHAQETEEDKMQDKIEKNNIISEKECRFVMSDGQHLTLNSMIKKRAPDYIFRKYHDKSRYTYYFNFCAPTIMTCNGEEDAMAIQKIEDDWISILARGKASYIEYIDETSPRKGVVLTFDGGDTCEYGNRKVKHVLKWDDEINYEIEGIEETETWMQSFCIKFII